MSSSILCELTQKPENWSSFQLSVPALCGSLSALERRPPCRNEATAKKRFCARYGKWKPAAPARPSARSLASASKRSTSVWGDLAKENRLINEDSPRLAADEKWSIPRRCCMSRALEIGCRTVGSGDAGFPCYSDRRMLVSRLSGPAPRHATYRKMKQKRTGNSPLLTIGQKLLGA